MHCTYNGLVSEVLKYSHYVHGKTTAYFNGTNRLGSSFLCVSVKQKIWAEIRGSTTLIDILGCLSFRPGLALTESSNTRDSQLH